MRSFSLVQHCPALEQHSSAAAALGVALHRPSQASRSRAEAQVPLFPNKVLSLGQLSSLQEHRRTQLLSLSRPWKRTWGFGMAHLVRRAFGLTGQGVALRLAKQAWVMLQRGFTADELEEAVRMALEAPNRRFVPRTMWFFVGWILALRRQAAAAARRIIRLKERDQWRWRANSSHDSWLGDVLKRNSWGLNRSSSPPRPPSEGLRSLKSVLAGMGF